MRISGCGARWRSQSARPLIADGLADLRFGLGPDPAPGAKPLHKPTISSQEDANPMLGETGLSDEGFDFGGEAIGHATILHAFACRSIHATTFKRRTPKDANCGGMKDGWIERLWQVIKDDERSERAISMAAGLGPNYLQQTRSRGTHPVTDKLSALLEVLGPEAALYVYTGMQIDPETVEFIDRVSALSPDQRKLARDFFDVLLRTEETPKPLVADHGSSSTTRESSQLDHSSSPPRTSQTIE